MNPSNTGAIHLEWSESYRFGYGSTHFTDLSSENRVGGRGHYTERGDIEGRVG